MNRSRFPNQSPENPEARFRPRRGFTLVEVIISIGVLAVMIPAIVAAMVASSRDAARARAENRSNGIVAVCQQEIAAARNGTSAWLDPVPPAGPFPADGLAVLGFSQNGRLVGRVEAGAYRQGLHRLDGKPVQYLARIEGNPESPRPGAPSLRTLKITVEYPAGIPANRRRQLEFISRIP